jgi:hypothetical protein
MYLIFFYYISSNKASSQLKSNSFILFSKVLYISFKSLVLILIVFVATHGLNIKNSCSKISLSTNKGISIFSKPNGGIHQITQLIVFLISSAFANLISLVQNSFLNFLAFKSLSQIVVTI